MTDEELNQITERVRALRKREISRFAGMRIDMDCVLCVPAVHARCEKKDMDLVMDFGGNVRQISDGFPQEKADLLTRWVNLHAGEILDNHGRVNHLQEPVWIPPLEL